MSASLSSFGKAKPHVAPADAQPGVTRIAAVQLASFEYDVTGRWSEPTVKRVPRPAPATAPSTGGE